MAERPTFPPAVLDALRKGNKIEAIKLLRAASKTGLAEAKAMVEAVQAVRAGKSERASRGEPDPSTSSGRTETREPRQSVGATAVRQGPPIPGYVPHSISGLSPGELPRGGGDLGWIVVVAAALAVIFVVL